MQDLSHRHIADGRRAFRRRYNALTCRLAGDSMMAAFDRLEALVEKGGFDPSQPRVPAGSPEGGQWGDGSGHRPYVIPLISDFLAIFPDAIGGAAGGLELPSLAELPDIPASRPADGPAVTTVVKSAARWLQSAKESGTSSQARGFFNQLLDTSWLRSHMPRILSYLDEPKTEQELQDAVSRPRAGFETHHRNERAAAAAAGYPRAMINGRANLMLVPTLRHWEVTGWYMTPNRDFGMLTPRQYLYGRSWEDRTRIGNEALRRHGILNP